jgi:putative inorganic carbon (hco3(-)) transporter
MHSLRLTLQPRSLNITADHYALSIVHFALAIFGSLAIAIIPFPTLLISAIALAILIGTLIEPGIGFIAALLIGPWAAWMNTYYPGLLPIDAGQIMIALTLGAWLLRGLRQRNFTLPRSSILIPLLLYVGWAATSMVWAADLSLALPEVIKWIEIIVIMLFTIDLIQRRGIKWILVGAMLTVTAQALIGIYEARVRGVGPLGFQLSAGVYRAYGTFEQPNPFAGFIGLVLPVAVALTAYYVVRITYYALRTTRHVPSITHYSLLVIFTFITLLLAAAIYLSFSRGAWLAAVAAIGIMIVFAPRRIWIGLGLVVITLGALIGLSSSGLLPDAINQRFTDASELFQFRDVRGVAINDVNYALIERQAHWQAALNMLTDQPWTGVGFANYATAYDHYRLLNWPYALGHAHNIYLNVAAETGLIGLAAYLILWLSIFTVTFRTVRRASGIDRALAIGLMGTWVYLSVHMLVDNLYVNNTHLLIGALFGLLAFLYSRTRSTSQLPTSNFQSLTSSP